MCRGFNSLRHHKKAARKRLFCYPHMKLLHLLLVIALALSVPVRSQSVDSARRSGARPYIAPMVLAGATAVAWRDDGFFSRGAVYDWRQRTHPGFSHDADDYLQFAPVAVIALLDMAGVQAADGYRDLKDQISLAVGSQLMMAALVFPLKEWTAIERPNGANRHAFPSGHTAQAFLAATLLHRTFGRTNKWYSIAGYTAAAATGTMRVLNNAHWLTDVLAGAAIGIVSVNLMHDIRLHRRNRAGSTLSFHPAWSGAPAVGMTLKFGAD